MSPSPDLKLSICIGTYNRAAFIGATLESIIPQVTSDCEIVVFDNASTDHTEQVISGYARRFNRLRYIRQEKNQGMDRNYDCAIEHALGEYCWLFSDDDLMKPIAVSRVLERLRKNLSLILVNVDIMNFAMSKVLQFRVLDFEKDRLYASEEMDRLFLETRETATFIGNIIIKRAVWLSRNRERYYGSMYIHVGAIFQEHLPGEALVIAEPLVSYRLGNANTYSSKSMDILFVKLPLLMESLALSATAKKKINIAEPWKHPRFLMRLRGLGFYSLIEYRRWVRPRLDSVREWFLPIVVALVPGILINGLYVIYCSIRRDRAFLLHAMRQSQFHIRNVSMKYLDLKN